MPNNKISPSIMMSTTRTIEAVFERQTEGRNWPTCGAVSNAWVDSRLNVLVFVFFPRFEIIS